MEFNKPTTQNSDNSLPDLSTEKVQLTYGVNQAFVQLYLPCQCH